MRLFLPILKARRCGADGVAVDRLVHGLHWRRRRADCRQRGPSLLQSVADALSTRGIFCFLCRRGLLILKVQVLKTTAKVRGSPSVAERSAALLSFRLCHSFCLCLARRYFLP